MAATGETGSEYLSYSWQASMEKSHNWPYLVVSDWPEEVVPRSVYDAAIAQRRLLDVTFEATFDGAMLKYAALTDDSTEGTSRKTPEV